MVIRMKLITLISILLGPELLVPKLAKGLLLLVHLQRFFHGLFQCLLICSSNVQLIVFICLVGLPDDLALLLGEKFLMFLKEIPEVLHLRVFRKLTFDDKDQVSVLLYRVQEGAGLILVRLGLV